MSVSEVTGAKQFLTFKLAAETFAVEVGKVREILDLTTVTKVPQTPDYLRGVINLRGRVVPVIDLRVRFGMPRADDTVNTRKLSLCFPIPFMNRVSSLAPMDGTGSICCIIVVEVTVGGESVILGTLADSVQEVFDLESGLDIDNLFADSELQLAQQQDKAA